MQVRRKTLGQPRLMRQEAEVEDCHRPRPLSEDISGANIDGSNCSEDRAQLSAEACANPDPSLHLNIPCHSRTPSPQKRSKGNDDKIKDDGAQVVKRGRVVMDQTTSPKKKLLHRQSTISVDSSVDSISRRPRVLMHQSIGSSHGFSMFGSVDSEQSVPRTAPLATPEQDMSLLENFSFDNDPMGEVFQMDTEASGGTGNASSTSGNAQANCRKRPVPQADQMPPIMPPPSSRGASGVEPQPHFNVEITPPQINEPEGATCLPDVVPKPLAFKHRPSLSAQMSSSLDTDSSLAETSPLFQYSSSSSSATAFPFNSVEQQDSGTSSTGSVPDTPDVPELKKLKQKKLVTTPTVVNITRLPCLPERSTYPVELSETLPQSNFTKKKMVLKYFCDFTIFLFNFRLGS